MDNITTEKIEAYTKRIDKMTEEEIADLKTEFDNQGGYDRMWWIDFVIENVKER